MVASSPVASSPKFGRGIRRIEANGDGSYQGEPSTDGNQYWDEEEGWVDYTEGTTKIDGDKTYVYRGGKWELLSNQTDPENPTPLGDTPWIWMALLVAVYLVGSRKTTYKSNTKRYDK